MPTATYLDLYRGWRSCVGLHCGDGPLFGECGDAKLIVSVSFGSSAVFRWRRQSCPYDEGHLCWLGHGDILVMDGRCQDKFLHRTDPCREQERINDTFRWVKQHASPLSFAWDRSGTPFANKCAVFIRSFYGECWFWYFLVFWFLLSVLCKWRVTSLASLPVLHKTWVTLVCLLLDTPFGRRSVGALPL